ncbi:MAG: hypothetical protein C0392_12275 [Syntrophus sp. (in: bacteria)]|nr:hypothetical protein [Syntrophus sp. (in: bacteria)]
MYRIFLTTEFLKQLDKIEPQIRKKLDKKIEEYIAPQLKQEPHFGQNVKKLRGYEPETWRYRIGSFRLFYIIDEKEKIVAMISIDDRKVIDVLLSYEKKEGKFYGYEHIAPILFHCLVMDVAVHMPVFL